MIESHLDDLHLLVAILPQPLQTALQERVQEQLLEIVMDLGRLPQARIPGQAIDLSQQPVTHADLANVIAAVGEFSADNRAGIEGTLHRISALRNRRGHIIGLTLRVGRAVFGTVAPMLDLVERGRSILLLGPPGVGKTTRLREVARVLADEFNKRVIVIDTSNEIGGDGDIPHPAIGGARRMQVPHPERQHGVMIEAVENHMPEVIIVDEIGTAQEALAARTIAERGVQLIGTAHGTTLENLVQNPTLADLVGGVQTVTLGDDEARLRGTQKTISERKGPPTFETVVEIVDRDSVVIHEDAGNAVDDLLRGAGVQGVRRGREMLSYKNHATPSAVLSRARWNGELVSTEMSYSKRKEAAPAQPLWSLERQRPVRICLYAISRDGVERVIRDLRLEARVVKFPEKADFILALRSRADDPRLQKIVQATRVPLYEVKRNTTAQIRRLLQNLFNVLQGVEDAEVNAAVREVTAAVQRVADEGVAVALAPRCASIRQLQHRVAARHRLLAESVGNEPVRHLVIHPG